MVAKKAEAVRRKRERILLAAVEMFLEKDFYQVTITEIATRAAVGKGTVYEYFNSKEDLFKESYSYCAQSYIQAFRKHLAETAAVRKTMGDILGTHLEMLKSDRKKLHLLFNERPLSFQELQNWVIESRRELLNGIVDLIQEGIRLKEVRPDMDVEMAGRLFLALTYVVMGGMVVLDNIEVAQEQIDDILDIYWNGIGRIGV